jgi:hypothetical protein
VDRYTGEIRHVRVAAVRKHALSLPETTEEPHFDYSSFRVRGKIFVTVPPDEDRIHVFVGEEHRARFLAMHPAFLEPLPWGKKIVGLRITLAKADAAVVKQLVTFAWQTKAPKTLQDAVPERE